MATTGMSLLLVARTKDGVSVDFGLAAELAVGVRHERETGVEDFRMGSSLLIVAGTEDVVKVDFGLAELAVSVRLERETGVEDFRDEPGLGVLHGAWPRISLGPPDAATVGVGWCLKVDDGLAVASAREVADGETVFGV